MATTYFAHTSKVSFLSNAPLEKISATTTILTLALSTAKNELAMSIPLHAFNFPNALMQEHFNENYVESEKYPKCVFKGKINEAIDYNSSKPQAATVKGTIELHGVTKEMTIAGTFSKSGDNIKIEGNHLIKLADFNIRIPQAIAEKIAETVEVSFCFELKQKQ